MATRCNVLIECGDDKAQFYRHWDGYPEGAGMGLKSIVERFNDLFERDWTDLIGMIKNSRDGNYEFEGATVPVSDSDLEYDELFDNLPNLHGDIEYLYTITVDENKVATLEIERV